MDSSAPGKRNGFVIMAQHRSGSSFLHNLVKVHDEVHSINEPFSQHILSFRRNEIDRWTAGQVSDGRYHPTIQPGSIVHERLASLARWVQAGHETHGFKETLLFRKLDWLDAVVRPRAYVYLVRDPRATIASLLKLGDVNAWWSYAAFADRFIEAELAPLPSGYTGSLLEKTALVWNVRAQWLADAATEGRWIIVRLEDIMSSPDREGERIMTHLGRVWTPRQAKWVRSTWSSGLEQRRDDAFSYARSQGEVVNGWKKAFDRRQVSFIEQLCGPLMQRLGYPIS
ncbi:sulfotransferase [Actinoplanes sp. NPDC049596]|uniref:sulfotransferase n=1 Tax=unclassified Actinoplanes TaxID=2626549 RepID=UPI0034426BAF